MLTGSYRECKYTYISAPEMVEMIEMPEMPNMPDMPDMSDVAVPS